MTAPAAARAAFVATACLLGAGCAALTDVPSIVRVWPARDDGSSLPRREADERRASLAPRTLPVEVHFVRHDPRDPAFGDALWQHVDEQSLDTDLRRRLRANGLRAGVVTGRLPATIADRLAPPAAVDPAAPEDAGLHRLLRLLPGKRAEVIAAAGIGELVLLEHGSAGVAGGTYRDATALVSLQAWPDADGRIRIRMVPEVKHGAIQRSWVGEEGMFRLETGQARRSFDDLALTARLPAGGTLILGTAHDDGAAVGDALLRDREATAGVRMLVIRPLAAAADPMFAARDGADEPDPDAR